MYPRSRYPLQSARAAVTHESYAKRNPRMINATRENIFEWWHRPAHKAKKMQLYGRVKRRYTSIVRTSRNEVSATPTPKSRTLE